MYLDINGAGTHFGRGYRQLRLYKQISDGPREMLYSTSLAAADADAAANVGDAVDATSAIQKTAKKDKA